MFGANLVILAQIDDELSHGQAEFPRIVSQNGQNDHQCQGQRPPFSIPAESIPGCLKCRLKRYLMAIKIPMLWRQTEIPRIMCQNGQNDLEGQG